MPPLSIACLRVQVASGSPSPWSWLGLQSCYRLWRWTAGWPVQKHAVLKLSVMRINSLAASGTLSLFREVHFLCSL